MFSIYSHEIRSVSVYEGAQGQPTLPGRGEVRNIYVFIALCLPLAPVEKLTGSSDGFWVQETNKRANMF